MSASLLHSMSRKASTRKSKIFNSPIDFSSTFTEYIISILLTNPEGRTEATLKRLQKATYEINFFKKLSDEFSEEIHLECCKHMRYELAPKGSFVFLHGDTGDKFYIMVDGSADVLVPEGASKRSTLKIGQLVAGSAFGELALIKNQPRMASILCTSHCHLATLSKTDYETILSSALEKQLEAKVDFLGSLQVFANWTKMSLTKLSYFFTECKAKGKIQLYKEGSDVSKIFLVKRGELKIFKNLQAASDSHAHSIRQASRPKRLDLAIVSAGEFLGVEDLIAGSKHSNNCESLGMSLEYYEIGVEDFVNRVMSQSSFSVLKSKVEFSDSLRRNRFEVFSKQMSQAQLVGASTLTPSRLRIRKELSTKGLKSFGADRSRLRGATFMNKSLRSRKSQRLQETQVQSPSEIPSPTLNELLAFNKSNDRKIQTSQLRSISVKKISNKVLEPLAFSTKLRALRPVLSLSHIKKASSYFFSPENEEPPTDFAFIHVDTMTPRNNIWDEHKKQLSSRQFSTRLSPRYCDHG